MNAPVNVLAQAGEGSALTDYFAVVLPRQLKEQNALAFYWFARPAGSSVRELQKHASELLTDSVDEEFWFCPMHESESLWLKLKERGIAHFVLRQLKAGVTDNAASAVKQALTIMGMQDFLLVATGTLYAGKSEIPKVSHNNLTERVKTYQVSHVTDLLGFPHRQESQAGGFSVVDIDLDDDALVALSKERLLSLTLSEMQAIRAHFKDAKTQAERKKIGLTKDPTDVELEIIAQTWSEHCKHKIFNAKIEHTEEHLKEDGQVESAKVEAIDSLYKTYIKGATAKLKEARPDLLSVFEDNAGVVAFDDDYAVCFKVETHNSPSALEPYGGALTGILGVNRDILGTGLGAKPIFNTDVFCFPHPQSEFVQGLASAGLIDAAELLAGVRQGVQDGGNKSGIPTVNGAVFFDDSYRAKPLVYCGTGGILPLKLAGSGLDAVKKHTKNGDHIVMAGGLVGRDGVHGATFSSLALDDSVGSDVVQIGDPFTQKRLTDFVLAARDAGLITGITDNGAGGLSSSVGEMAGITGGATMEVSQVPLKYPGLADWQIVVSESQERMTISTDNVEALLAMANRFDVMAVAIGQFDDSGYFRVTREGKTVALLNLEFLHDGAPRLALQSKWTFRAEVEVGQPAFAIDNDKDLTPVFKKVLAHPNVCSREAIIRQYDHEVQGGSVIKPLMGPAQKSPCDAGVVLPRLGSDRALAVSCGMTPLLSQFDPYLMAQCSADEAVRNAVCVGADPDSISLLDNFCWPDPVQSDKNPLGQEKLAQLVLSVKGLHDICMEYGTPLISGKDSMKNNFDDGKLHLAIEPTLLVSAMGIVPDCNLAVSSDFKNEGDLVYLIAAGAPALTASVLADLDSDLNSSRLPHLNTALALTLYRRLYQATGAGLVQSMHDVSDGGLAITLAECALGGAIGLSATLSPVYFAHLAIKETLRRSLMDSRALAFAEGPGMIVASVAPGDQAKFEKLFDQLPLYQIGKVGGNHFELKDNDGHKLVSLPLSELLPAFESQAHMMGVN